jgi:hypothetical protein
MGNIKETKTIKGFGVALIVIGLFTIMLATLFACGHEAQMLDPTYSYRMGMAEGIAIGLSLTGGILGLSSAANS